MGHFNVRVYGILFDSQNRILISDEYEHESFFIKFPGGGLEYGEGTLDALKREFIEECGLEIQIAEHIYTTDFFVKSAFNDTQVISIYYRVNQLNVPAFRVSTKTFDFPDLENNPLGQAQSFRWIPLNQLDPQEMTFETEKHVVTLLKNIYLPQHELTKHV